VSWLDDQEIDFRYVCEDGHKSHYKMPASTPNEVTRADATCTECGKQAAYDGFEKVELRMSGRVLFEQNGRYGYRITGADGKVTHVSKTKWDYLDSMGRTYEDEQTSATGKVGYAKITPGFTPAYKEHLQKIGRTDLLEEKLIKSVRDKSAQATNIAQGDKT